MLATSGREQVPVSRSTLAPWGPTVAAGLTRAEGFPEEDALPEMWNALPGIWKWIVGLVFLVGLVTVQRFIGGLLGG